MKILNIREMLEDKEGENVEFKEAKNSFEFDELAKYLSALSNSGGGYIAFGITDKRPRCVVGSSAFNQPERTRSILMEKLKMAVDFECLCSEGKRVLVFRIPAHPIGVPVHYEGECWKRIADHLVKMERAEIIRIQEEGGGDFSAGICSGARWADLSEEAIEAFKALWVRKSGNKKLLAYTHEQLLQDSEVVLGDGITYAAMILFGRRESLGRLMGNCELVYEYRATESAGPAQQRVEFREGFFSFFDKLWVLIDTRNNKQHYQDGLFIFDIPTFDESIVREAVLNSVCHRNYQLAGSVFVRQYANRLVVDSPGGFPIGVTSANILNRQSPRNRLVADVLLKCGLVERSGQGMNLMFERSVQQSKALPSFEGSDDYLVHLVLDGLVRDSNLLLFMNKIGQETLESFSTEDFLLIDAIHQEQKIPSDLKGRITKLVDLGVVERVARGKFVLGRRFYVMNNKQGVYTRKKGLDRETKKALLLKHITENGSIGTRLKELYDVLPGLERSQLQVLIRELVRDGRITKGEGKTSAVRWFAPLAIVALQLARFMN